MWVWRTLRIDSRQSLSCRRGTARFDLSLRDILHPKAWIDVGGLLELRMSSLTSVAVFTEVRRNHSR